jgi:hypothetical protein
MKGVRLDASIDHSVVHHVLLRTNVPDEAERGSLILAGSLARFSIAHSVTGAWPAIEIRSVASKAAIVTMPSCSIEYRTTPAPRLFQGLSGRWSPCPLPITVRVLSAGFRDSMNARPERR